MRCYLTDESGYEGKPVPRRFTVTDKHGLSRQAYNLQLEIDMEDETLALGLSGEKLPESSSYAKHTDATVLESRKPTSAADLIDDLSSVLKKRPLKASVED